MPSLREQQEEINRLTYVAEEWSAEEPHRTNEGTMYYNTIGRSISTCHCSTPNMSLVLWTTDNIGTMRVRDTIGIITMTGGTNTTTDQKQIIGDIHKPYLIQIVILQL